MLTDQSLIQRLLPISKSTIERFDALVAALAYLDDKRIVGDVVECGVYKGANIILARKTSPGRVCWLYDTFAGMTAPTAEDGPEAMEKFRRKSPWMVSPEMEVRMNLESEGVLDESKLRFVAGDVTLTLGTTTLPDRIAMLRLDTDWYGSTLISLVKLWPLVVPGGVLMLDDYGYWRGARKAFHHYFTNVVQPVKIDGSAVQLVKQPGLFA